MRGPVVPLGERRDARELEAAERHLGRSRGHRLEPRSRPCVPRERLEVLAHRAEPGGADVQRLACDRSVEAPDDRLYEVLDGEQLVAIRAVAEDRDPAALADPVEQDLEHAEPLGADEGLGPDDHHLEPASSECCAELLRLDLGGTVVPHADERVVLEDRMSLRDAVDSRRRHENHSTDAGLERGGERDRRPLDVDRADRGSTDLDRERRGGMDENVRACDEPPGVRRQPHVATQLVDRAVENRIVERQEIEGAHVVPVAEEAAREVQAEKARAARDRDEHGAER